MEPNANTIVNMGTAEMNIELKRLFWLNQMSVEKIKAHTSKRAFCENQNASFNSYVANPDDPDEPDLGNQLMQHYTIVDNYLMNLHSTLSNIIETSRAEINKEKAIVERVMNYQADLENRFSSIHRKIQFELDVLKRTNQLPHEIVRYIGEYLPTNIVLMAIHIPANEITTIMEGFKMKNIKGIYYYIMRYWSSKLDNSVNYACDSHVIRKKDFAIVTTKSPANKKEYIGRIINILKSYHVIFNILCKLNINTSTPLPAGSYANHNNMCISLRRKLENHLIYIYKLIHFVSKPEFNARAKPKPSAKATNQG